MTKLYTVKATVTYVVAAENESAAVQMAHGVVREVVNDQTPDDFEYTLSTITETSGLPAGWTPDTYAYGYDTKARNIGEILEDAAYRAKDGGPYVP